MMGALSLRLKGRLSGGSAAALLGLSLVCATAIVPAEADKVGVAAAVNPDAFSSLAGSPQSQLSIGKSIFYNERINTTGSGLVQVLLVDGSTFTVGPGSDLVIDKFVYDPKKGTGQIAASFSKGVMRFVGGKISKNDNGVTVNTPAGTLAIRGGISYVNFISPKDFAILFVYGEYLKLQGQTLFEKGYGWFSHNGQMQSRPFDAKDLAGILAALTNSNPAPNNQPSVGSNPSTVFKLVNTQSLNQLISDANTNMITGDAQEALNNQPKQPTNEPTNQPPIEQPPIEQPPEQPTCVDCEGTPLGEIQGYAAGLYAQSPNPNDETENELPVGVLANWNSTHVNFKPNDDGETFSALFKLRVGEPGSADRGGANISFGDKVTPTDTETQYSFISENGGLLAFAPPDGVTIFHDNGQQATPGELPAFAALASSDSFGSLYPSDNNLALTNNYETHPDPELCDECDFLKWGAFVTVASFMETSDQPGGEPFERDVAVLGWWVAGDIPPVGQLPATGGATYAGTAVATVATDLFDGWRTYVATGKTGMTWDFGTRSGSFEISQFDTAHFEGGLTFNGPMCAPGVTSCGTTSDGKAWTTPGGNHFGGPLTGTLPDFGPGSTIDRNLEGFALGSFVRGPTDFSTSGQAISGSVPQGVIGNWGVGNDRYMASGIFGGTLKPNLVAGSN